MPDPVPTFQNLPSTATPLNANNLNELSTAIVDLQNQSAALAATQTFSGVNTFSQPVKIDGPGGITNSATLTNTQYPANPTQSLQTPFDGLWHDMVAFNNNWGIPTQYTSSNGTTFTSTTLNTALFGHIEKQSINVANGTTVLGAQWVWNSSNIAYSVSGLAGWLVIGHAYSGSTASTKTVTFATSSNGTTWTTRYTNSYNTDSAPVWHYLPDWGGDTYAQLTIVWTAGGNVALSSIRVLTPRWGDQGGGSEQSFPYSWTYNSGVSNITMAQLNVGSIGLPGGSAGNPRLPINSSIVINGASLPSGTSDKVALAHSVTYQGGFSAESGYGQANPDWLWGADFYTVSGTSSGDLASITDFISVEAEAHIFTPGATLNNVKSLHIDTEAASPATSATTITNLYGIDVAVVSAGPATVTNAYGIHIAAPTNATNNYALKTSGGQAAFGGPVVQIPQSLTFGTTLNTNAALGNLFRVTLTNNFTLANPTNSTDGQIITWELIQDGSGSRLITLGGNFNPGSFTVTLTTTLNKRDFLTAVYNAGTTTWYITNFVKGY